MGCSSSKPAAKPDSKLSNDIERQRILAEKKAELAKAMKKPNKDISKPLTETENVDKEENSKVNEPVLLTKPESTSEGHITETNKPAEE
ncbi:uncharacterized protein CMU_018760 [Cryptosporidium muris RN66]|uniref:Uncharacterized protein n=1 Tax=Cryptosporidium muris (strain RN66) TaxID=441375 RepID=B6ADB5_CRYMR|nr:uncharacterized protein CMU_018760 [Cryptosporidium muris RN66]EEA06119.1 hypothetical protein, conserved [Cryptosporidium muris RN66]|eukprot:XP_002140468.1 hypothetical protein [Cryptosporidium muris RN66]